MRSWCTFLIGLFAAAPVSAEIRLVPVTDNVFALVGEKAQRSPENLANNATFGVVVTSDGAVLIDPGGSWKGAAQIHAAIRSQTDQPVRVVLNTGGQDHRWLGNGYWRDHGARIMASNAAVEDQRARASMQLTALSQLLGETLDGTEPVFATETFDEALTFDLGGVTFEIVHPGPAHTPGDSYVFLPEQRVMFTGDIVYTERILGVIEVSNSASWIEAFEAMAGRAPVDVVPGHGAPTTLERATADTYEYLVNLRTRMREHIEAGGDIIGAVEVDQSAFRHLEQFDALARRNAQQIFAEMEWE